MRSCLTRFALEKYGYVKHMYTI